MENQIQIKLAMKLTTEVELLLGVADTSAPGLFVLHAAEGKLKLCRREILPEKCHVIARLRRASVKDGLTADQWITIQNKIIRLLLSGGLKL